MGKQEGGPDEGQAGFTDDLEKAWGEMETGDKPETVETPEPEPDESGRLRDPVTKRFVSKAKDAEGEEPDEEGEGEAEDEGEVNEDTPAKDALAPPEHWSQADKDAFNALPPEMRPLYLEKAKSLESGWNKKFEDVANERKAYESLKGFQEIFEPYQQQLQTAGLTPQAYVQRLIATALQLQANPEQTLRFLAQQYGVDLGKPPEGAEQDDYADPRVVALEARLAQQDQFLQQFHQSQAQATQQSFEHEWTRFVDAKDAQEHPTFPKADVLKFRMGQELQVNPPKPGEAIGDALKRAYDAVKWIDPEIRTSILEAETKAKDAERQRKADLDKAKGAGRVVKGKSAPNAEGRAPKDSWKDELEANWDQASA